ncbi:MAG: hypothetical protein NVSMB65_14890 [Chloroflexota bacterium]
MGTSRLKPGRAIPAGQCDGSETWNLEHSPDSRPGHASPAATARQTHDGQGDAPGDSMEQTAAALARAAELLTEQSTTLQTSVVGINRSLHNMTEELSSMRMALSALRTQMAQEEAARTLMITRLEQRLRSLDHLPMGPTLPVARGSLPPPPDYGHTAWVERQDLRRSWTIVVVCALGLLGVLGLSWVAPAFASWSDMSLRPLYQYFAGSPVLTVGLCTRAQAADAMCSHGTHTTWNAQGTHVRVLTWLQVAGNRQAHALTLKVGHAPSPRTCRLGPRALVQTTARVGVLASTWDQLTPVSLQAPGRHVPWSRYCFVAFLDGHRQSARYLTVWWGAPRPAR